MVEKLMQIIYNFYLTHKSRFYHEVNQKQDPTETVSCFQTAQKLHLVTTISHDPDQIKS
jgi:hypothetical protein